MTLTERQVAASDAAREGEDRRLDVPTLAEAAAAAPAWGEMNLARLLKAMPPDLAARLDRQRQEGTLPPVDPGTDPEQVRAGMREQLARDRRELWARVLADWPDEDFTGVYLGSLIPEQKPGAVRAWMAGRDGGTLLLAGPTGRGKTRIGFAIGNELAETGVYCYAINHKRYLDSLRPDGSDEPAWLIRRRAMNAEFLVWDDFGAELDPNVQVSEHVGRETNDLLSARLRQGKRTVISTNLPSKTLGVMFSARVISRLKQNSMALVIEGPDWREIDATW